MFIKSWYDAGIKNIADLKDDNGNILSFDHFCRKFNLNTNFMQYYGIISAIPRRWRTDCPAGVGTKCGILEKINSAEKPSKIAYNLFLQQSTGTQSFSTLVEKCKEELNDQSIDSDTLENAFRKIYGATISTRIRSFQFRLNHRILGINEKLYRWGIKADNRCDLCKSAVETYKHLFCDCDCVKPFLAEVGNWIRAETQCHINFSQSEILLGMPNEVHPVFDLIYTIAKMFIYYCKFQNTVPTIQGFINRINNIKETEKYISIKNNTMEKFNKKWFIVEGDHT